MKILNWRLLLLFVVPNVIILALMILTPNVRLIGIFNALNLALSTWVVVAFSPVVFDVLLTNRHIDRADYLGMGIFLGWSSIIVLRTYSIVWRWLDQPLWLTDSDILNYGLFLQTCAAVLHLAAPDAIENRVPPRRWIKIGAVAGAVVLICLLMGYFFDAFALDLK